MNYYPDRSEFKDFIGFHKDSGGDNIFVNLIFDNKNPIEATGWFADVAKPSAKRKVWQEKLLPDSHLAALASARDTLRAKAGETSEVSGGVTKGKYAYVSWVDDLVWYSTPSAYPRLGYTAEAAERLYGN